MPLTVTIHFETVATAFMVADIAQPIITTVSPETRVDDAVMTLMEDANGTPDNWFGLVRQGPQILGYLARDFAFDDANQTYAGPPDGAAGDYCTPITPDQIVPVTLPLLDLIPLFQSHYFFFVLTGNDLTHVVSFIDLDQLPVRLSLFALIIGLEADLIRVFTRRSVDIPSFLDLLPPHRRQQAAALAQRKRPTHSPSPEQVLISTTFIDKITMLTNSPALAAMLPLPNADASVAFFQELHELRNRIAHSDSILETLPTPAAFAACLSQLRAVMTAIGELANRPE